MSALTRYPVPQGVPTGAVDDPRLYFRLPPTLPDPALASEFDGTNDFLSLSGNLTGITDTKTGIISVWLKVDTDAQSEAIVSGRDTLGTEFFRLLRFSDNTLRIRVQNTAGTTVWEAETSNTITTSDAWVHILASWDLANTRGQLYIDDVDRTTQLTSPVNDFVGYSEIDDSWGVGARGNGGVKFDGCLSQVYFTEDDTIDLAVTANRRLFINANLTPVDLGSDGSNPTGSTPIVYFNKTAANFHLNGGTGGDFTQNGALTICPPPHGVVTLQPLRGLEALEAVAVNDPQLYFRLEAAIAAGRIWNLIGPSGLIGHGGGLIR